MSSRVLCGIGECPSTSRYEIMGGFYYLRPYLLNSGNEVEDVIVEYTKYIKDSPISDSDQSKEIEFFATFLKARRKTCYQWLGLAI